MKYAFFTVPIGCKESEQELNSFCSSHRILSVEKHFVADVEAAYWAFCISYLGKDMSKATLKQKVDYKEILSANDFAVFAELRKLRKDLADKAGIPAYAIFTNEQLASFVRDKVVTKSAMGKVSGVGESKIKNYAEVFLSVLQKLFNDQGLTGTVSSDEKKVDQT